MTTRSGTVIAWSPPCPLAIAVDLDLRRPRCGHRPHSPPRPGQDRRGGDRQACCPDQDPRRERLPAEAAHAVGRRRREREAVRIDPEKFVQVGGCAEQPESREAPPGPGLPTAQGVMGNEHGQTQAASARMAAPYMWPLVCGSTRPSTPSWKLALCPVDGIW